MSNPPPATTNLQRCTHQLTTGPPVNGWVLKVSGTLWGKDFVVRAPFDKDGAFLPRQWLVSDKWAMSIESDFFNVEGYRTANSRLAKAINLVGMRLIARDRPPSDDKLRTATGAVLKAAYFAALRRTQIGDVHRLVVKNDELVYEVSEDERKPVRPFIDKLVDEGLIRVIHLSDAAKRRKEDVHFLLEGGGVIPADWSPFAMKKGLVLVGGSKIASALYYLVDAANADPDAAGQAKKYNFWHAAEAVMLRAGTILCRKGGILYTLDASDLPHLDERLDGTVAVTMSAPEVPMQGTARSDHDDPSNPLGKFARFIKGVLRRPIIVDGMTEREGISKESAFGYITDPALWARMVFHAFDVPAEQSSGLNTQLVAFSAADQGIAYYDAQAGAIDPGDPLTIARPGEREWVDAGVPLEFALDGFAVRDAVRKQDLPDGYRAMVYGCGLSESGDVMIADDEIRLPARIAKRMGLKPGDTVRIARDPGIPNGASVREFTYAGTLSLKGSSFDEGIALSASSEKWLEAGGDFDGDTAITWPADGQDNLGDLHAQVSGVTDAQSARDAASAEDSGSTAMHLRRQGNIAQRAMHGNLIAARQGSQFSIGKAINKVSRLWVAGSMNIDVRSEGMTLGQGAIDMLKHEVLLKLTQNAQNFLGNRVDQAYNDRLVDPDLWVDYRDDRGARAPDLISAMGVLKRAGKNNTFSKDEAWDKLVETANNALAADMLGEAGTAFAQYILKLAEARETYRAAYQQSQAKRRRVAQRLAHTHENSEGLREARRVFRAWKEAIRQKTEAKADGALRPYLRALSDRAKVHTVRARALLDLKRLTPVHIVAVSASDPAFIKETLTPEELKAVLDAVSL